METKTLHISFKAFEETVKGILSEPFREKDSSNRAISPDGIKYYNVLAREFNSKNLGLELMLFREDSTPNLTTYPKAVEVLSQIKIAIDVLNEPKTKKDIKENSKNEKDSNDTGKPKVFIGCSVEGLNIAKIIQMQLEYSIESTIWHQGVFGLSFGTLETLVAKTKEFDYAVLVLTPDDLLIKRGEQSMAARDNVMFELGLFMGSLGRTKTFIVCNKNVSLPTDLAGITPAIFEENSDNLVSALGPICTKLEIAMDVL